MQTPPLGSPELSSVKCWPNRRQLSASFLASSYRILCPLPPRHRFIIFIAIINMQLRYTEYKTRIDMLTGLNPSPCSHRRFCLTNLPALLPFTPTQNLTILFILLLRFVPWSWVPQSPITAFHLHCFLFDVTACKKVHSSLTACPKATRKRATPGSLFSASQFWSSTYLPDK